MSPTISTKKKEKRELKSRRAMEREKLIFLLILSGCVFTVFVHVAAQVVTMTRRNSAFDTELKAVKAQRLIQVYEDKELFAQELEIAETAQRENLAEKKRQNEWRRRLTLDPEYANSEFENKMLRMKAIGADPDKSDKEALTEIAKLASPPRSGVLVTKEKRGYKIEVAFAYDEVIEAHPEVANYTPGVYREVRRTAAGIMRDVFDFGSGRKPYRMVISCQHMVTVRTSTGRERQPREMYVVTGKRGGKNWGSMTRAEAEDAMKTELDSFPSMMETY